MSQRKPLTQRKQIYVSHRTAAQEDIIQKKQLACLKEPVLKRHVLCYHVKMMDTVHKWDQMAVKESLSDSYIIGTNQINGTVALKGQHTFVVTMGSTPRNLRITQERLEEFHILQLSLKLIFQLQRYHKPIFMLE